MKRRRRVESSVSKTENDVDFLAGLEEDLGVAPTVADPATTQFRLSASTVPASSRALREVSRGGALSPSVPTTLPGVKALGQSSNLFAALTEIDPMPEEPHIAPKWNPDLVWFGVSGNR